jgi:SAM-dependent methyltransferase
MSSVASTFDSAAMAYEQQLQIGLSLSGEAADYFVRGRVAMLQSLLAQWNAPFPSKILDFGCGVGNAAQALLANFPSAKVTGLDCSTESLTIAEHKHAALPGLAGRLSWVNAAVPLEPLSFDAAYTSGVFHHIVPDQRPAELRKIHEALRAGGLFALFENNPWNPGTRWIMSRIPFDRAAICLSPIETRRRLKEAGFEVLATRYLFFFPRWLGGFRRLERWLTRCALGAQYVVLARRRVS